MTTKRKLMMSIASLGVLVILAGVAFGIALAALTGNVNSGFNITYTAYNVNASVWGLYVTKYDTTNSMTVGDLAIGLDFYGDEPAGINKKFDDMDFIIEENNGYYGVRLEYYFVNFDEKSMPLSVNVLGEPENLNMRYKIELLEQGGTIESYYDLRDIEVPYCGYSRDEFKQKTDELIESMIDEGFVFSGYLSPIISPEEYKLYSLALDLLEKCETEGEVEAFSYVKEQYDSGAIDEDLYVEILMNFMEFYPIYILAGVYLESGYQAMIDRFDTAYQAIKDAQIFGDEDLIMGMPVGPLLDSYFEDMRSELTELESADRQEIQAYYDENKAKIDLIARWINSIPVLNHFVGASLLENVKVVFVQIIYEIEDLSKSVDFEGGVQFIMG